MILGLSGAGKTWLARELARRTGRDLIRLDRLRGALGRGEALTAEILRRTEAAGWIHDGRNPESFRTVADRAGTIVVLDTAAPRRLARVGRFAARQVARSILMPWTARRKLTSAFRRSRAALPTRRDQFWIDAVARPPLADKVVRLRTPREVAAFLDRA